MRYCVEYLDSNTLIVLQNSTGRIRNYQLAVGGMLMMNFPLSYLCLKVGLSPETVFIIACIYNCSGCFDLLPVASPAVFAPHGWVVYVGFLEECLSEPHKGNGFGHCYTFGCFGFGESARVGTFFVDGFCVPCLQFCFCLFSGVLP